MVHRGNMKEKGDRVTGLIIGIILRKFIIIQILQRFTGESDHAKRDTPNIILENYECNLISLFGNNAVDLCIWEWEKNQDDWNKI